MVFILMGDNFGLNDNYEYYEFSLDSLDASGSFSNSSSKTDWPLFEVAAKGALQDIVAIKILEVEIPFSWYVFNSVNNSFIAEAVGDSERTVTITPGNYTASELATELQSRLRDIPGSPQYVVTYVPRLQKFQFTHPSAAFTFKFGAGEGIPGVQPNSGNKNPRLFIGFPPGNTSSAQVGGIDTITSPNVVQVSGPNYIYLNSSKLGSDVDVYLPAGAFNLSGGKAGAQLAKIPVNSNTGGVVIWQDPDPQKWFKYDQLQSLNTMDFYLTLGNTTSELPLKLNGLGFSVKLGILKLQRNNTERVVPTSQGGRVSMRQGPKRLRPMY